MKKIKHSILRIFSLLIAFAMIAQGNLGIFSLKAHASEGDDGFTRLISFKMKVTYDSGPDRYVTIADDANNTLIASTEDIETAELFYVMPSGNGGAFKGIQTESTGQYLKSDRNPSTYMLMATAGSAGAWESFLAVETGDGSIVLKDNHDNSKKYIYAYQTNLSGIGSVQVIGATGDTYTSTNGRVTLVPVEVEEEVEIVPVTGIEWDSSIKWDDGVEGNVLTLVGGEIVTLTANIVPDDATNQEIIWTSSDPDTVAVNNGAVSARKAGFATISAKTADGDFEVTCTINVTSDVPDPVPGIYTESELGSDDVIVYVTNVLNYGADPTGEKDSTIAFQAAIDATQAAGGGQVFAPEGIYRFDGRLYLYYGITLRGEWRSPEDGGMGRGTILAVYTDKGKDNTYKAINNIDRSVHPFITMTSATTVRDISFWYPEQDINNVTPYPYTIGDPAVSKENMQDVINIMNVTMYNSYNGIKSINVHGCTTIRNLYGTPLNVGISEDMGFDIGRIENIHFDTSYWAESGLPGAPIQDEINEYTRAHTIGIHMFEDDWGYLYNLDFKNMDIGIKFGHANCAISNMRTDNVRIAIDVQRISYPGLKVANSYLKANLGANPICINYTGAIQGPEQVAVSNTTFTGNPKTAIVMDLNVNNNPVITLQNCIFENWQDYAIDARRRGSVIVMNSDFRQAGPAIKLSNNITAANILANNFTEYNENTINTGTMVATRINIDHNPIEDMPVMPVYEYEFAPIYVPHNPRNFYNVMDFGAVANGLEAEGVRVDDTAAIQMALDQAKKDGGGTVYMPGGTYLVDGSLTIPTGVELRGTFDGPHTGKVINALPGTNTDKADSSIADITGTVIVVSKNVRSHVEATVGVDADASLRGVTFYYLDQGTTPNVFDPYPWTVRGLGPKCSVTNVTLVNSWDGFDFMTYRCDGAVLADMNGYAHHWQVWMGNGMDGGWVQDVHFNVCNWVQSNWYTAPKETNRGGTGTGLYNAQQVRDFQIYTDRYTNGFKYGNMKNVYNFQNFTILLNTAILMVEESGGSFSGVFNGFAFDANKIGLDIEQAKDVTFINAMCVTDQDGGGPNVRTRDTFTGILNYFNGDSWGGGTQFCEVNGGTVNFVQYNAWSSPNAIVNGGTLNVYGSLFMHQGSSGTDFYAGPNIESAKFIGNIGHSALSLVNKASVKMTMQYNLNTNGTSDMVDVFRDIQSVLFKVEYDDGSKYATLMTDNDATLTLSTTIREEAEIFNLENGKFRARKNNKLVVSDVGLQARTSGNGGVWEVFRGKLLDNGNIEVYDGGHYNAVVCATTSNPPRLSANPSGTGNLMQDLGHNLILEIYETATTPSVTSVTIVAPDTEIVQKGKAYIFTTSVVVEGGAAKNTIWSVSGGTSSTIDNGMLVVGASETATELFITATSMVDPSVTDTMTVALTDGPVKPSVTNVTIMPKEATVEKGQTQSFNAIVEIVSDAEQNVLWSIVGGTDSTIDADGMLTVGENETSEILTVIAKSRFNFNKLDTAKVTVKTPVNPPVDPPVNPPVTPVLTPTPGSNKIPGNGGGGVIHIPVVTDDKTGKVIIELDKGTTDKLISDAIKTAEEDKSTPVVTLDLSGLESARLAVLDADTAKAFGEARVSVTINLPTGNITLGGEALSKLAASADDGTTLIAVGTSVIPMKDLKGMQAAQVKGYETVVNVDVFVDDKKLDIPITVSLPYTLKDGEDPNAVCVWYMDDEGSLTKLNGLYNKEVGMITFTIEHQSYYVVGYEPVALWENIFEDVKNDSWYFDAVAYANYYGMFNGDNKGNFNPQGNMTRAMFVTVLWNLEGKVSPSGTKGFADVPIDAWFCDAVIWATEKGIVNGVGNGMFAPNKAVTRQEMVVMMLNYASFKGYDIPAYRDIPSFKDAAQIDIWAETAAQRLSVAGVISGSNNEFRPKNAATRAEVAQMLKNFMRFVIGEKD